jgi:hypothetical protein
MYQNKETSFTFERDQFVFRWTEVWDLRKAKLPVLSIAIFRDSNCEISYLEASFSPKSKKSESA